MNGALLAVVSSVSGLQAAAQPLTDLVPRERVVPLRESLEQKSETYRLRLGPLRLAPRLGFDEVTYEKYLAAAERTVEDWRVSAVGGTAVVTRLGRRLWVEGNAEARYDWYAKEVDRRRVVGNYDGSVTAFLGRLTARAGGGYGSSVGQATPETELVVDQKERQFGGEAEFELLKRLSLWGRFGHQEFTFPTGGLGETTSAAVSTLDRTQEEWRAGFRYRFSSRLWLGVAAEGTRVDFDHRADLFRSTSRGGLLSLRWERPRLFVNMAGGYRRYERLTSQGPEKPSGAVGALFVGYRFGRTAELQLYSDVSEAPSIFEGAGVYRQERLGTGFVVPFTRFLKLSGFYERSWNRYDRPVTGPEGGLIMRRDTIDRAIGRVDMPLGRLGAVGLRYEKAWYESTVSGTVRSTDRLTMSLLAGIGVF